MKIYMVPVIWLQYYVREVKSVVVGHMVIVPYGWAGCCPGATERTHSTYTNASRGFHSFLVAMLALLNDQPFGIPLCARISDRNILACDSLASKAEVGAI
jgi:hypothetical protein